MIIYVYKILLDDYNRGNHTIPHGAAPRQPGAPAGRIVRGMSKSIGEGAVTSDVGKFQLNQPIPNPQVVLVGPTSLMGLNGIVYVFNCCDFLPSQGSVLKLYRDA